LRAAKVPQDSDKKYLGADLIDAETRGADLFREPANNSRKSPNVFLTEIEKAIKLTDEIRNLVMESGLSRNAVESVLRCVTDSLCEIS
jgi:hypothetical protein